MIKDAKKSSVLHTVTLYESGAGLAVRAQQRQAADCSMSPSAWPPALRQEWSNHAAVHESLAVPVPVPLRLARNSVPAFCFVRVSSLHCSIDDPLFNPLQMPCDLQAEVAAEVVKGGNALVQSAVADVREVRCACCALHAVS